MQPLTALGIDFGEKRLGVALMRSGIPHPHSIIAADANSLQNITALCAQESVHCIVVGISEGATAQKTRAFFEALKVCLHDAESSVVVTLFDETLSSQQARALPLGQKRLRNKQPIDDIAAAIILEEWYAAGCPGCSILAST